MVWLYKGYIYQPTQMVESDNVKIYHEIYDSEHRSVHWEQIPKEFCNISPYREATQEEFESAVEKIIHNAR